MGIWAGTIRGSNEALTIANASIRQTRTLVQPRVQVPVVNVQHAPCPFAPCPFHPLCACRFAFLFRSRWISCHSEVGRPAFPCAPLLPAAGSADSWVRPRVPPAWVPGPVCSRWRQAAARGQPNGSGRGIVPFSKNRNKLPLVSLLRKLCCDDPGFVANASDPSVRLRGVRRSADDHHELS